METSIPDLNQTEYEATEYEAPAGTIPAMQNILSSDSLVLLIVILTTIGIFSVTVIPMIMGILFLKYSKLNLP